MPTIYKLSILSDEEDKFLREYGVQDTTGLRQLNDFICIDLKLDQGIITSFFSSDDQWNKGQEYTMIDMGIDDGLAPISMEQVTVADVCGEYKDRLVFMFDTIEGRCLFIENMGSVNEGDNGQDIFIISSQGELPDFDPSNMAIGEQSIFDEAFSEFDDFEGDEFYGDDL